MKMLKSVRDIPPAQSGSVAMFEHTLEALDSTLGGQDFGAQECAACG
jgi:hypothetical protein